jgi:hypothetical protein
MWRYLYTVQCTDPDLGHIAKTQYRKIRNKYSRNRNCAGLSPNFHIHVSVRDLYIPTIGLPILLQENVWTDPGNICIIAHRHMNVESGTEATQFLFCEYVNGIFVTVHSQPLILS